MTSQRPAPTRLSAQTRDTIARLAEEHDLTQGEVAEAAVARYAALPEAERMREAEAIRARRPSAMDPSGVPARVLAVLQEGGAHRASDIATRLGAKRANVNVALGVLLLGGLARRLSRGLYEATTTGEEVMR